MAEKKRVFPNGFLWGAATSAHQVEGNNKNNDWWQFEVAGKVKNKEFSGQAADHYRRFEEDFALAKELGQNSHRLSIEWSRIEPQEGHWNLKEIEHYRAVLKAAKKNGLKTMVTLHHFTSPIWLAQRGGWEHKKTPELFARYAKTVAEALGGMVDLWVTINEPGVYITMGVMGDHWPPAKKKPLIFLADYPKLQKRPRFSV